MDAKRIDHGAGKIGGVDKRRDSPPPQPNCHMVRAGAGRSGAGIGCCKIQPANGLEGWEGPDIRRARLLLDGRVTWAVGVEVAAGL